MPRKQTGTATPRNPNSPSCPVADDLDAIRKLWLTTAPHLPLLNHTTFELDNELMHYLNSSAQRAFCKLVFLSDAVRSAPNSTSNRATNDMIAEIRTIRACLDLIQRIGRYLWSKRVNP
jgi:hypothetical protein